jgi:hypothetical protein
MIATLSVVVSIAVTAQTTAPAKKKTASHPSSKAAASKSSAGKKRSRTKGKSRTAKTPGQKAIQSERAQQIQEALIREHYMNGEPSGRWDDATESALRRYQADQGWQSKSVPDSRALIKLGLGPSHDHLLNPESAMTTGPMTHKASKTGDGDGRGPADVPAQEQVPQR